MSIETKMDFIDYKRKKRIWVTLSRDGEDIDFKDTVEQINQWIEDALKVGSDSPNGNKTLTEIFPLCAQLLSAGIVRSSGEEVAMFILSNQMIRHALLQQMMLSYYFLKFVQKNGITVTSEEEDITEEEIQRLVRVDKANSMAAMGSMLGMSPKDIVKEMLKSGQIQKEDLKGLDLGDDDETSGTKDSN